MPLTSEAQAILNEALEKGSKAEAINKPGRLKRSIQEAHDKLVVLANADTASEKAKRLVEASSDRIGRMENASEDDLEKMVQTAELAVSSMEATVKLRAERDNN